jgi:hypothetical protein
MCFEGLHIALIRLQQSVNHGATRRQRLAGGGRLAGALELWSSPHDVHDVPNAPNESTAEARGTGPKIGQGTVWAPGTGSFELSDLSG